MGAKFSRRTPANKPESAVSEQTAAEEPDVTQTQEAAAAPKAVEEKPEVVLGESETLQASEQAEECKEAEAPAASTPLEPEPEPEAKDTPDPAEPEPLVSVSEPSPPEPVEEPKPVAPVEPEPLIETPAPEPVEEPKPVEVVEVTEAVPETVPEPEVEVEAVTVPEPLLEPEPVSVEEPPQVTDLLNQETLPEPELPAAPLIDLGIPEPAPQTIDSPPSPPPSPVPVSADECPESEERQESPEAAVISAVVPEEETSVENPNEAAENMEQLVSDVSEESVSGLLKQLDLTGNDLVSDLTDSGVKIPDESSIIDVNTSTEMM